MKLTSLEGAKLYRERGGGGACEEDDRTEGGSPPAGQHSHGVRLGQLRVVESSRSGGLEMSATLVRSE